MKSTILCLLLQLAWQLSSVRANSCGWPADLPDKPTSTLGASATPRSATWTSWARSRHRKGKLMLKRVTDINVLAATLVTECGGEPYAGIMMVGEVIANRARQSGKSLREVCLASKQFSCWNNLDAMLKKMETMKTHPAWDECLVVAAKISQPGYKTSSPATHYFNP